MNTKKLLLSIIVIMAGNEIMAQDQDDKTVTIEKTTDFEITGDGNASAWEKAEWIELLQRDSKPETYETKVKILYSETGIYFLFDCQDKKLIATIQSDNEDLWEEDVVEVFLWTNEQYPVYFEYELSPLNYELPLLIPNFRGDFLVWLPWHYEGERKTRHKTSAKGGPLKSNASVSGWMAEFFIPFALMKPLDNVPPESGTKWRANMYRIDYDQGQTKFSWQKINKSFHEFEKFGTLVFK